MANTVFKLRRSSVAGKVPNTSTLAIGELGLNLTDRKLYSSDGTNVWETGANLTTLSVSTNTSVNNVIISGGIYANGAYGTTSQVLTSNGSGVYWAAGGGSGGLVEVRQQYTGDGVTNTFTVTGGYQPNRISVYLNGVLLRNGSEANVASGTTFSIPSTPPNNSLIDIVGVSAYYANTVSSITSQQFTANGTANSFTITGGYIPGQVQVYLNGVKQLPTTDVIISSGNTVDFIVTPSNNYTVDVYGYQTANYLAIANVDATYIWSNNHTFTNSITFSSTVTWGNSTINSFSNSSTIKISNSTTNATLSSVSLEMGNTTVNTTVNTSIIQIYNSTTNTSISSVSHTMGNTVVNTTVNTSVLQIANSTGTANITPTSIFLGNSSVNCVINSTSVYVNGVDYNPTTALAIAVALS